MIHTLVFLLLCELTQSAIYGSQKFDSHKWPTVFVDEVKGKPRSVTCVDHYILLLNYLSNRMHFITNGYKRFSKTNSTDSRQRVPLMAFLAIYLKNKLPFAMKFSHVSFIVYIYTYRGIQQSNG